jgi:hypothetical protein
MHIDHLCTGGEHQKKWTCGRSIDVQYVSELSPLSSCHSEDEQLRQSQQRALNRSQGHQCAPTFVPLYDTLHVRDLPNWLKVVDNVSVYSGVNQTCVRGWPAASVAAATLLDAGHTRLIQDGKEITTMEGINVENMILSQTLSSTPVHVEDHGLTAVNDNYGDTKTWYFLRRAACGRRLIDAANKDGIKAALMHKQCFTTFPAMAEGSVGGRMSAAVNAPDALAAIVQPAGARVVSCAGWVWHHTVSVGVGLATAVNGMDVSSASDYAEMSEVYQACLDVGGETAGNRHAEIAKQIRDVYELN